MNRPNPLANYTGHTGVQRLRERAGAAVWIAWMAWMIELNNPDRSPMDQDLP